MDEILRSHLIDPKGLRADDFDAAFRTREAALLDRIQAAMGKPIARDLARSEPETLDEYESEAEAEAS